jgi:hypothetical protein
MDGSVVPDAATHALDADFADASLDAQLPSFPADAGEERLDAARLDDAATPAQRERAMLVDHAAWEALGASEDPFEDRFEGLCTPGQGFFVEEFGAESSLSVGTLYCDYLSAAQPSLVDIAKGDEIVLRLWQYTLTAPEGAELHLGLYVGDERPWEARVTIPRESGLITAKWRAKRDVPMGTRIVFHLHNHGDNQYNLLELSTGPASR